MTTLVRITLVTSVLLVACSPLLAQTQSNKSLFDMKAILDESTLDVEILKDWHLVRGPVPTRQKTVTIRVGELLPGREYRVPVRFVVPDGRKATGFHLTGGHQLQRIKQDARLNPIEAELIKGGVGLVHTMVQVLKQSEQGELGRAADSEFFKTLNPKYSIQYWGWPATLMRAITAAHSETDHFTPGKVALSGGSKNGASPSCAIIHDNRMTAVHASVSPIWDSPLRLCDKAAWKEIEEFNVKYADQLKRDVPGTNVDRIRNHSFLGGTFGPVYNRQAIGAGNSWEDLQALAESMADNCFISRNLDQLKARGVDLYFEPGTHDFVCFDLAWGGKHHSSIPVYLRANSGHGIRSPHRLAEKGAQNLPCWLFEHFFETDPLLTPPETTFEIKDGFINVQVKFTADSKAESGRIWWIYDRGPDGSAAYIRDLFPDDNCKDMNFDPDSMSWNTKIKLDPKAKQIDFFSNHRKSIRYQTSKFSNYISSPYTRVQISK